MKITDVRTVLLTTPYGIDGCHTRRRSAAFIEVETDEGIVGIGETYAGVYVPDLVPGIVELYREVLVGRDATVPARLYRDCYWVTGYCGRTGLTVMVLAGIECALWDALGRFRNAPVHELLGGAVHDRLPLYASGGVPTLSREQLVAQAVRARDEGYRGFKMRANPIAYQPQHEAERVALVRDALGPDMLLAVDAVQSLNTRPWSVKQVLHLLDALTPYDLAWAEEFLPPFDPVPYAELRAKTATPISGGEGITTATVFEQWLRAGAFDIAQPDPTIIGGLDQGRRACEAAEAHHVRVAMHVWGSAPTLAAAYHLGFSRPNCVMLERPIMNNPLETEMLREPLRVQDGYLLPPSGPGIGVELTDDVKAAYRYEPGSGSMFG